MSFELNLEAALPREVPRLLHGQIAGALAKLRGTPDAAAIHAARRHIKKARAVLRLLDEKLHGPLTRGDQALRAAGRHLSARRDEAVLVCTIDSLVESGPPPTVVNALRLLRETLPAPSAAAADPGSVPAARQALLQARRALTGLALDDYAFDTLVAGFRTSYRAGRRALRPALADPRAKPLHTLRKALKHHVYQLRVLRPLWPQPLAAFHAQADHAAELLGLHHDCALLRARLAGSALSAARQARIDTLAAKRQASLASAALGLCQRLYAEAGASYTRRLTAYWQHPLPAEQPLGSGRPGPGSAE